MADVFVSYAREDREKAREFADLLKKAGLDVWWDHNLAAGDDYRDVIEKELKAARCVIVMWSPHSIRSPFVMDEADIAQKSGKLVPAKIAPCDPPLGFRSTHTRDVYSSEQDIDNLVADVSKRVGPKRPASSLRSEILRPAGIGAILQSSLPQAGARGPSGPLAEALARAAMAKAPSAPAVPPAAEPVCLQPDLGRDFVKRLNEYDARMAKADWHKSELFQKQQELNKKYPLISLIDIGSAFMPVILAFVIHPGAGLLMLGVWLGPMVVDWYFRRRPQRLAAQKKDYWSVGGLGTASLLAQQNLASRGKTDGSA
jgi:hypothetical protein